MNEIGERPTGRLDGLDLARFFAFFGMVIVNFKIAMGADKNDGGVLNFLTGALEGRAAATFVILAGVGLGLAAIRSNHEQTILVTLKRALFLLCIGLLNSLIFEADILHYYAFYFLFGVFCLPLSNKALIATVAFVNVAFMVMVITLNYDAGWNWDTLTYSGFWTPIGFVRNLFFNGWHPVIPWISFLIYGIWLSRLRLGEKLVQHRMILIGTAVFLLNGAISFGLTISLSEIDKELAMLFGNSPVPPMPLYIVAGLSAGTAVIGLCLRTANWFQTIGFLKLVTPAGRQTLSLYIAHVLIGMGTLQALGMIGGQTLNASLLASFAFCVLATIYAYGWSKLFKRGPIEAVMRKLAG